MAPPLRWHPEGGVVEALREIVEDSMLPTHFEAMADEVGVEIARTVRAAACVRPFIFRLGSLCSKPTCFRTVAP